MIGSGELIVILGLGVLLFGSKKVPELARSLGLGLREFKRACRDLSEEEEESSSIPRKSAPQPIVIEPEPDDKR